MYLHIYACLQKRRRPAGPSGGTHPGSLRSSLRFSFSRIRLKAGHFGRFLFAFVYLSHFWEWWKHKSDAMLHIKDTRVRQQPPRDYWQSRTVADFHYEQPSRWETSLHRDSTNTYIAAQRVYSKQQKKFNKNQEICLISSITLTSLQSP